MGQGTSTSQTYVYPFVREKYKPTYIGQCYLALQLIKLSKSGVSPIEGADAYTTVIMFTEKVSCDQVACSIVHAC